MINYDGKKFRPIAISETAETSDETIFIYRQQGSVLTGEYAGGKIKVGHLIGIVDEKGRIDMRYHQINHQGELMTGKCVSSPALMDDGKIRLYETWQWTSGDYSEGESILEEI